jgi:hypothetical protein
MEQVLTYQNKWEWLGYVLLPIIYLIKIGLITLCVYTGFFLALPQKVKFIDIVPAVVKANLFLTHSGNGSVLEAIHFKVPMLLFPLNVKWDQNGTAARVVFHGLGEKSNLNLSKFDMKIRIDEFFESISFTAC